MKEAFNRKDRQGGAKFAKKSTRNPLTAEVAGSQGNCRRNLTTLKKAFNRKGRQGGAKFAKKSSTL
jgi:hypothetical protein